MAEYLDVVSFRDRGEGNKPFAIRLGSARKRDDGGLDIYLDALPAPSLDRTGKVQFHMRVSERQPRREGGYDRGGAQPARGRDLDDEIPF